MSYLPPIKVESLEPMYIKRIEYADVKKRGCETWLSQKTSCWDVVGKINTTRYVWSYGTGNVSYCATLTDPPESRGAGQGIRKKGEPSFPSPLGPLGSLVSKWIQDQIIGHI